VSSHLFGFNGQLKDNEVYGEGDAYTAEFWEYDARLGRRWNRDPKPIFGVSDYAAFKDNPIMYVDPMGDSVWVYATTLPGSGAHTTDKVYEPTHYATHTFIVVKDKDNQVQYFEYGPADDGKVLGTSQLVKLHYQQDEAVVNGTDKDKDLKAKILVTPPKGQTTDEFDKSVINSANGFANDPDVKYVLTGGGDDFTGNCNTSTTTILSKAGLSDKDLSAIENRVPGIDAGFGKVKAWTKGELKQSLEIGEKNKKEADHANAILGPQPKI